MVDAEPAVDNSDICKSIVSIDQMRIKAAAIVESGTIIGYHYNSHNSLRTEEEHDISSRMQSVARSVAGHIDALSAESSDLAGQMLHSITHGKKLDLLVFPMPYAGSPRRILVIASKALEEYGSLVRLIQHRIEQMKA